MRYIIAVFVIAVLIVRTGFFVSSTYAAAGINQTINFQGKLVDDDGLNVADGNYDIVFYLYAASSGGSPLWTETWNSGTSQVAIEDGVFRVALGTHSTFSSFDFNDDSLYLAIKVGADAEMTPRIRFTSVPYAFVAKTVVDDALDFAQFQDTLDVDANLTVNQTGYTWTQTYTGTSAPGLSYTASGAVTSGNAAALDVNASNASTTVPAMMLTNAGSSFALRINDDGTTTDSTPLVVDANGNVGIGTTAPNTKLDVIGQIQAGNGFTGSPIATILAVSAPTATTDAILGYKYTSTGFPIAAVRGHSWSDGMGYNTGIAGTSDRSNSGTNVGGYFSAANGSANYALVTDLGNVGIGTLAPVTTLHVVGAATITGGIRPAADSTTALQLQNVAGTSVLNVDTTNSRVGIGTTSPDGKVKILDDGKQLVIDADNSGTNYSGYPLTLNRSGGDADGSLLHGAYYDNGTYYRGQTHGSFGSRGINFSYSSGILFYADGSATTKDASFTPTEVMRITNTGNVGIGTTAPTQALHVVGSARITGALYDSSNSAGSSTNILTSTGTGTAWSSLSSALDTSYFKQNGNSFTALAVLGTNDAYGLAFETSDTERLRIDTSGNVGIGTSSPGNKLEVVGGLSATGINGFISSPYRIAAPIGLMGAGTGDVTSVVTDSTGTSPEYVAVDPTGRFVYVTNTGSTTVQTYTINQSTGDLTSVGTDATGTTPQGIAVDPTGRFVYVANSGSDTVQTYTINQSTGDLTSVGTDATGTYPYGVAVDPTGRFAYVTNASSATIQTYTINQSTGDLTSVGTAATGTNPLIPTVDPTGRFVYVVNSGSTTVQTYTINQSTGDLTSVGTDATGTSPYDVAVDPTGRFAYVTNYGSTTVQTYTINQSTGDLTSVGTDATGTNPYNVAVDPTGRFAYVTNYGSTTVQTYTINQSTGDLTSVGTDATGTYPTDIAVDPTGRFVYVTNYGSTTVQTYTINNFSAGSGYFAGNVGIGTTVPTSILSVRKDVNGISSIDFINGYSGAGSTRLRLVPNDGFLGAESLAPYMEAYSENYGSSASGLAFGTYEGGLTERMRIAAGGNVGIGTTAPTQELHVAGDVRVTGGYYDSSNAIGSSGYYLQSNGSGTAWTDLSASLLPSGTEGQMLYNNAGTWTAHSGTFWDDATSRLGIGTTSPSSPLEVAGDAEIANYLYFGNTTSEYLRWDASNFLLSDDLLPNANDTLNLGADASRWADLYLGGETIHLGASTTDEGTISYTSSNVLSFGTDSTTNGDLAFFTDDLYLDKSTSNVGIGTTAPGQKLDLIGSLELEPTTSTTTGVIYKGATRFLHDYSIANTERNNIFLGLESGSFSLSRVSFDWTASHNIGVGYKTLNSLTYGTTNVAIGSNALKSLTGGHHNLAIGGETQTLTNTGGYNLSIGSYSLNSNISGGANIAIGYRALTNATSGNNVAVGFFSGRSITTGSTNVFIGNESGYHASQKVDAANSIAIGAGTYTTADNQAIYGNSSITQHIFQAGNVGIGTTSPTQALDMIGALKLQDTTTSTAGVVYKGTEPFIHNFHPSGSNGDNTFMGIYAGNFTMSGTSYQSSNNTGVGTYALNSLTTGYGNSAFGVRALPILDTGMWNSAFGYEAMYNESSGYSNTAMGNSVMRGSSGAIQNAAIGENALYNNTSGRDNVALGYAAGRSGSGSTGVIINYNTLIGSNAGYNLMNGGDNNVLIGYLSGYGMYTGAYNIALGTEAGRLNNDGSYNIFQGYQAGRGTTSYTGSDNNIALGQQSLYSIGSNADSNIALGYQAGYSTTTGDGNIFLGYQAGYSETGSDKLYIDNSNTTSPLIWGDFNTNTLGFNGNVGIGTTAPAYNLDVKASGTNIARFIGSNSTGCTLSDGGIIACSSDRNLKKNIVDGTLGLDALMQLRPVTFNWNSQAEGESKYLGFIAQEVEQVAPELVTIDSNGYRQLNSIGIIPIVAKAIQEQQGIITTLQTQVHSAIPDAKIATVSAKLENLNTKVSGWDGLFISIQSIIQSIQETFVAIQSQLGFVRSDIQSTKEQVASLSASLTDIANWKEAVSSGGAASGQSTGSAVLGATDSAMLGEVATASSLMVRNDLQVDGRTTLFDLTVLNKLTSGVIQIGAGIDGDEINASTGIRFQTLAQGPVDFMNGKVIIDVDGSISAKHFKLDTLDATSSTGGKAIMPAGELLTTVQTTSVNANSMIYVTIQGDYAPATRYWVTNQVEGDSFMVQFDRPTTLPVEFSWFIIN